MMPQPDQFSPEQQEPQIQDEDDQEEESRDQHINEDDQMEDQEEEQYEEEEDLVDQTEENEMDIKSDDLEAIAVLYDQIRTVRKEQDPSSDKELAEDFDKHLKTVMFELSDQLKQPEPYHIKNSNIVKAKMQLYEICFTKAKEYLDAVNPEVGNIFGKI